MHRRSNRIVSVSLYRVEVTRNFACATTPHTTSREKHVHEAGRQFPPQSLPIVDPFLHYSRCFCCSSSSPSIRKSFPTIVDFRQTGFLTFSFPAAAVLIAYERRLFSDSFTVRHDRQPYPPPPCCLIRLLFPLYRSFSKRSWTCFPLASRPWIGQLSSEGCPAAYRSGPLPRWP